MRNPKNGKTILKQNLPSKICIVCNRPFTWRKKWERVWDEVSTCSKSCNASRRKSNSSSNSNSSKIIISKQEEGVIGGKGKGAGEGEVEGVEFENENENENKIAGIIGIDDDDEGFNNDYLSTTSIEADAVNNSDDPANKELTKKQLLRKQRKDDVKIKKQERRLKREGNSSPDIGRKSCDICSKEVDMLIRCTIDETQQYKMICGKCWPLISGGIPDGNSITHPYYNYGGLWKNRNASSSNIVKKRIGNGTTK
jgi:hypothetical protein